MIVYLFGMMNENENCYLLLSVLSPPLISSLISNLISSLISHLCAFLILFHCVLNRAPSTSMSCSSLVVEQWSNLPHRHHINPATPYGNTLHRQCPTSQHSNLLSPSGRRNNLELEKKASYKSTIERIKLIYHGDNVNHGLCTMCT